MTDQEILDNAPKNTSIVDSKFKFFDDVYCELDKKGEWNWKCSSMPKYPIRSLVDIKRIAELENHIQSLKVINEYVDEGNPDIKVIRAEIGEVISRVEGTYFEALKEQGK